MLQLANLTKTFQVGEEAWTLGPLDLKVKNGEFLAILGQSGSGKSTLLHLIGGLIQPNAGTVVLNGKNLYQMNDQNLTRYRNRQMGFIFQEFYLLENLDVFSNVVMPLLLQNHLTSAQREKRVEAILVQVGLEKLQKRLPRQLSGGQRQRVAIARAFVHQPQLVLADEPTGNLDEQSGAQVLQLLQTINQQSKTTLLCVTHDAKIAAQADRIIRLSEGKIVVQVK